MHTTDKARQEFKTITDIIRRHMPDHALLYCQTELEDLVHAITSRLREAQRRDAERLQMMSDCQGDDIA